MVFSKIAIGADHGGFEYKNMIISYLKDKGIEVIDAGTFTKDSCDYPMIASEVADMVATGRTEAGILVCGSGIGMSIAANRVKGVRAALCTEPVSAELSREHNNSNILCLGQRLIGESMALKIIDIWLNTKFIGGRHQRRVDMLG